LKQIRREKAKPYPLSMANGQTSEWVKHELRATLRIGEYENTVTLDITKIPKYDVVLGMAWLHDHNPQIDWKRRMLTFPSCSTEAKMEGRSPSKVPIIKAI